MHRMTIRLRTGIARLRRRSRRRGCSRPASRTSGLHGMRFVFYLDPKVAVGTIITDDVGASCS
jgi:hypothetical protein